MAEPTRAEHLAWCKTRAIELLDAGDLQGAFNSMASDLQKHDATRDHIGLGLGMQLLIAGHLNSPAEMRRFIEGFN